MPPTAPTTCCPTWSSQTATGPWWRATPARSRPSATSGARLAGHAWLFEQPRPHWSRQRGGRCTGSTPPAVQFPALRRFSCLTCPYAPVLQLVRRDVKFEGERCRSCCCCSATAWRLLRPALPAHRSVRTSIRQLDMSLCLLPLADLTKAFSSMDAAERRAELTYKTVLGETCC